MNFLHLLQNYRIKILKTLGRYNYIACFIYSTKFHVNLLYIKKIGGNLETSLSLTKVGVMLPAVIGRRD